MNNITIDTVMEYIIIMLSPHRNIGHELTDGELILLLDIIRDKKLPKLEGFLSILNNPIGDPIFIKNRKNLSRSSDKEMYEICELLDYKIKYQPERLTNILSNRKLKIKWKKTFIKNKFSI